MVQDIAIPKNETVLPQKLSIGKGSEQTLLVTQATDTTIVLEEGAKLTFILFATEGWEGVPKITFEFLGRNSELQFIGIIIGTGTSLFKFETISYHVATNTKAHYRLKAAMFDRSVVDYKGNLVITKPAQLSDTYLSHDTLLLSDYARAKSVPALEIEADDVKAGHAATIGKVDDELMFYLLSRGIDPKEAEQMLITSFFEKQLTLIPDLKMREDLQKKILEALPLPSLNEDETMVTLT